MIIQGGTPALMLKGTPLLKMRGGEGCPVFLEWGWGRGLDEKDAGGVPIRILLF